MLSTFFPQKSFRMSDEEIGKISAVLLKILIRKAGAHVALDLMDEIIETPSRSGIPHERVIVAIEILTRQAVEEMFTEAAFFNPFKSEFSK
jgi:hypothetical protein